MANEPKHQGALQHGVAEIDPWPNMDKFATLICKTSKMVLHQNGYEYELWSKILQVGKLGKLGKLGKWATTGKHGIQGYRGNLGKVGKLGKIGKLGKLGK